MYDTVARIGRREVRSCSCRAFHGPSAAPGKTTCHIDDEGAGGLRGAEQTARDGHTKVPRDAAAGGKRRRGHFRKHDDRARATKATRRRLATDLFSATSWNVADICETQNALPPAPPATAADSQRCRGRIGECGPAHQPPPDRRPARATPRARVATRREQCPLKGLRGRLVRVDSLPPAPQRSRRSSAAL